MPASRLLVTRTTGDTAAIASSTRGTDATYKQVVAQGLWAEPGLGDLDLEGFLAALPGGFARWVVVEVDKPSLPTPEESVSACARWTASAIC